MNDQLCDQDVEDETWEHNNDDHWSEVLELNNEDQPCDLVTYIKYDKLWSEDQPCDLIAWSNVVQLDEYCLRSPGLNHRLRYHEARRADNEGWCYNAEAYTFETLKWPLK